MAEFPLISQQQPIRDKEFQEEEESERDVRAFWDVIFLYTARRSLLFLRYKVASNDDDSRGGCCC